MHTMQAARVTRCSLPCSIHHAAARVTRCPHFPKFPTKSEAKPPPRDRRLLKMRIVQIIARKLKGFCTCMRIIQII